MVAIRLLTNIADNISTYSEPLATLYFFPIFSGHFYNLSASFEHFKSQIVFFFASGQFKSFALYYFYSTQLFGGFSIKGVHHRHY